MLIVSSFSQKAAGIYLDQDFHNKTHTGIWASMFVILSDYFYLLMLPNVFVPFYFNN